MLKKVLVRWGRGALLQARALSILLVFFLLLRVLAPRGWALLLFAAVFIMPASLEFGPGFRAHLRFMNADSSVVSSISVGLVWGGGYLLAWAVQIATGLNSPVCFYQTGHVVGITGYSLTLIGPTVFLCWLWIPRASPSWMIYVSEGGFDSRPWIWRLLATGIAVAWLLGSPGMAVSPKCTVLPGL